MIAMILIGFALVLVASYALGRRAGRADARAQADARRRDVLLSNVITEPERRRLEVPTVRRRYEHEQRITPIIGIKEPRP
jgi:hypothetical protein